MATRRGSMSVISSPSSTLSSESLETFSLVWLDISVNKSKHNQDAQQKLRSVVNHIKTFEDVDECEQYIQHFTEDQIIFIVSGQFGQEIVPHIHDLRQVFAIYIYCHDTAQHEQWASKFPKIMAIVKHLDELVAKVQSDKKKHKIIDEPLPISFFDAGDRPDQSSSDLNGTFLYSQVLIDALIQMKENPTDKIKLIAVCKNELKDNKTELDILQEFESNYSQESAVWWYTKECFLYRMLNKALRIQNIDMLFLFQFFMRDLQNALTDLQTKQTSPIDCVYRGQMMTIDEVLQLKKSTDKLISMNSFLSTSLDRKHAVAFLKSSTISSHLKRVLFEINIQSDVLPKKPFADITSKSDYGHEQEVLFMAGTIFQLSNVRKENGLYIIQLSLSNDNDHNLLPLFEHMKKEIAEEGDLLALGKMLRRSGKLKQAEHFFRRIIKDLSIRDPLLPSCFRALGNVYDSQYQFDESLVWYEKALLNFQRTSLSNHPSIASTFKSIGNIYLQLSDFKAALAAYEKALFMYKQASGDDHQRVAMCLNNIGTVYLGEKQYSKAFEYFWEDLNISEKLLPGNHPDLAISLSNIGEVHCFLGRFNLAFQHLDRALKIQLKSLPHDHFHIASTYQKIASLYTAKGKQTLSLQYCEKANAIFQKAIPLDDTNALKVQKDIQIIKSKLK